MGPSAIIGFGFLRRPPAALAATRATRRYGAEPKAIPVVIALVSTGTEVEVTVLVTGAAITASTFFISTGATIFATGAALTSAFGKV